MCAPPHCNRLFGNLSHPCMHFHGGKKKTVWAIRIDCTRVHNHVISPHSESYSIPKYVPLFIVWTLIRPELRRSIQQCIRNWPESRNLSLQTPQISGATDCKFINIMFRPFTFSVYLYFLLFSLLEGRNSRYSAYLSNNEVLVGCTRRVTDFGESPLKIPTAAKWLNRDTHCQPLTQLHYTPLQGLDNVG